MSALQTAMEILSSNQRCRLQIGRREYTFTPLGDHLPQPKDIVIVKTGSIGLLARVEQLNGQQVFVRSGDKAGWIPAHKVYGKAATVKLRLRR